MANWNLAEKQIYKLLKHSFQKEKSDIEAITAAYLEFVEELFDYLNKENDNKTRIRQLNMSYIDFGTIKALEETSPTENSKLKIIYLDKLLSLINMEQELIYRQMEYPKFFINIESDWKSPFYLNSEVIKIIDIMELVCGIFYIKNGIIRIDNKDIFLSDISRIFEKMFNISFGDIYFRQRQIILSVFLSDKFGKVALAAFITANGNQGVVFTDQGTALIIVLLHGTDEGAYRFRFFVLSEKYFL